MVLGSSRVFKSIGYLNSVWILARRSRVNLLRSQVGSLSLFRDNDPRWNGGKRGVLNQVVG